MSVATNYLSAALGSALLRNCLPGGEPVQRTIYARPLNASTPWDTTTLKRARTLQDVDAFLVPENQYVLAQITQWTTVIDNDEDHGRTLPASAIEIAALPGASFQCSGIVLADDASLFARTFTFLRIAADEIVSVSAGDVLSLLPADL